MMYTGDLHGLFLKKSLHTCSSFFIAIVWKKQCNITLLAEHKNLTPRVDNRISRREIFSDFLLVSKFVLIMVVLNCLE